MQTICCVLRLNFSLLHLHSYSLHLRSYWLLVCSYSLLMRSYWLLVCSYPLYLRSYWLLACSYSLQLCSYWLFLSNFLYERNKCNEKYCYCSTLYLKFTLLCPPYPNFHVGLRREKYLAF